MKEVLHAFGSLKISVVLFLIFAFFCAIATFIESAYSTSTAWAMVYGTAYFGFVQLILGLNLACAIYRYKMINRSIIEKAFQHGGDFLRREGMRYEALATVESLEDCKIVLK